MTTTRGISLIVAALCVSLTFVSCAERRLDNSPMDTQHFDKKFTVNPGGTLRVKTDVGSVRVTGSSGNEVSIVADMHGSQRDLERFKMSADQKGNDVEVRGESSHGGSWFSGFHDFDVDIVISVPKNYNLNLSTAGGNVEVRSVTGSVDGSTSGGDVSVQDVEGGVTLGTSGGTVSAEKVKGDIRMSTSGGDVRGREIIGSVVAKTSGGNVNLEATDGEVEARTSGGNVYIKLNGKGKGIHAETSGGNIDFEVPRDLAADLDLSTSGGEVTCDFPITISGKIQSDEIRGTVNGGGQKVYGHTSGGNVTVRPIK